MSNNSKYNKKWALQKMLYIKICIVTCIGNYVLDCYNILPPPMKRVRRKRGRTERREGHSYPCTVRTLPMEGEEGGVAASLIIPVGEPWEGGDVEGTAKLTATPSSVSPRRPQKTDVIIKQLNQSEFTITC